MHLNAIHPSELPRARPGSSQGKVVIACPGGLENGGGIGRQMGYFLDAWASAQAPLRYTVLDTRGPWFLGAARWHAVLAGCYLARAMFLLTLHRIGRTPCIVHVNITGRGSTWRKLVLTAWLRAINLPYLLHLHDYDYPAFYRKLTPRFREQIRVMFTRADMVVVLGQQARDALLECMKLDRGMVTILHNAVPDPQTLPLHRPARTPCHFLFLGHLSARKGVPELLGALASAPLSGVPWRATLAGGGPVEEYRAQAIALGIGERVTFAGWVDQQSVRALCETADVLVLPSHAEGLAMSVLEGLAYGLAVVTTPVGAHPDVIEQDISGLLVPPGDVAALAGALARLAREPHLRARLRNGARGRFQEKFCIREYARRLADLHGYVLDRA